MLRGVCRGWGGVRKRWERHGGLGAIGRKSLTFLLVQRRGTDLFACRTARRDPSAAGRRDAGAAINFFRPCCTSGVQYAGWRIFPGYLVVLQAFPFPGRLADGLGSLHAKRDGRAASIGQRVAIWR